MAKLLARVVLPNADEKDYEKLHRLMAANGYKRTIKGASGTTYQMPDATYVAKKEMSVSEAASEVKTIADSVKWHSQVFVAEYSRSGLRGLNPAQG
ncbi:hypothetical protein LMG33818_000010 [Halomonadaceae bacterium LMG 33818]|uniref:hypothetical protein n=1 Tax=Cernens ardua TaxID=3402176 RepID=UPI003EDB758B